MARPKKTSLNYFPKDTDYYDDDKIIDLLDEYGPMGQTLYDVIITYVYKNSYYLEMSAEKLAVLVSRMIGNRWIEKELALEIIHYCADIGLLCKDLLEQNVITSVGIQRRYSEITARNRVNRDKYWLLEEGDSLADGNSASELSVSDAETEVNAAETNVNDAKTEINAAETPVFDAKTQQSKVNKNKANKNKVNAPPTQAPTAPTHNTYGKNVHLSREEYNSLVRDYGEVKIYDYINKIDRYIERSGQKPYDNHNSTIREWLEKDGVKKQREHSYDLHKLLQNAIDNVPVMDDC
ncbi:MAG: DUF4373 domain-containing protein [Oscillospiraceae bacterium]|nr:DUF4373 domain-containing protein [Oscillospiraceae bacterium]